MKYILPAKSLETGAHDASQGSVFRPCLHHEVAVRDCENISPFSVSSVSEGCSLLRLHFFQPSATGPANINNNIWRGSFSSALELGHVSRHKIFV